MCSLREVLMRGASERDGGRSLQHCRSGFAESGSAAHALKVPVLVGASEGEREFIGTRQLAALARSLREDYDFPIFLNADHTHSLASAWKRRKPAMTRLVFAVSSLPFDQKRSPNTGGRRGAQEHHPSILAEGEIGDIGTGSEIHDEAPDLAAGLTSPEEARRFGESTGIDLLAPAVRLFDAGR